MFTKRYVNALGVLIGLAVVSSILLYSGCGMTGSPNIRTNPTPTPTPAPDTTPPTSTITSPMPGATVLIITGTTVSITGTASDTGGSVARVDVSVDGGATYSAATGTTTWSFSWAPTTPGSVTIRSRAVDNSGNTQNPPAEVIVTVIRDTTPPTSTITSPKTGTDILPGTTVNITGTASDAGGGTVARVDVSMDGATFRATGTTTWSFSWTPTTPGRVFIIIRAVDNSGNEQQPPAFIFVDVVIGGTWRAQGPGPIQNGQVEKVIPNNEVVGAISTVAAHPTDANTLYVGAVNGGIWKTNNATAASPHWTPLIDNLPALSIGAFEFDPTDPSHQTLVAGVGLPSVNQLGGSPTGGIYRTTDGGDNWTHINPAPVVFMNISGIAARGATLLASASSFFTTGGVLRSADGGINWVMISGSNGLPTGDVFDLVGDPTNLNRFYVSVRSAGIFRSDDGGATWTNISSGDPALNGIITQELNDNTKMAVGSNGRLYVVVVVSGRAQYIGYIDNPDATTPVWTAMDLPQTPEADGNIKGLHPYGLGSLNLSIAVDRNDPNTVYVGGDRQPDNLESGNEDVDPVPNSTEFPNFIGANNFSGRLFRGDTRVAPTGEVLSPQWEHLTHSNSIQRIPEGGTASGSAPHAGSRDMVVDANGDLVEVDNGGIYRRASPLNNTGDWFSINSDIQTTELHDVAYDTNSNIIIGGALGAGTPEQITSGSTTWRAVAGSHGGDVAVDNITLAASSRSIRYSSFGFLQGFRRVTYDAANNRIGDPVFPSLTVMNGGDALVRQFITPLELNAIDPLRLVIGGANFVYESSDQGNNITPINDPNGADGPGVTAMAYGAAGNPDVLYVGSGSAVFLRTAAGADLEPTATLLPPDAIDVTDVRDIALDPRDWRIAYVVDSNHVFRTTNAGESWTDISGNLGEFDGFAHRAVAFVAGTSDDLLLVSARTGVFVSFGSSGFTSWNKLGAGLPHAPVWDLDYDAADDVLLAGTLGRGAWTIVGLRSLMPPTSGLAPQRQIRRLPGITFRRQGP
jgi:photosystem II stability/assembly factor-like uncharacterized protein